MSLWEMIGDAQPGDVLTLPPGAYDHDDVIRIRKDLVLTGPREAIVRPEFAVTNGAEVIINGVRIERNKIGAPQKTGTVVPRYPQNGHFVLLNSALWLDDVEMVCLGNGATHANKRAIECRNSNLAIRSVTKFSKIDWRNSTEKVITLYDSSYAQLFGLTGDLTWSLVAGTANGMGAALEVVGSKAILSGSHFYNFGSTPYGASVSRDSYLQVGAGFYTSIPRLPAQYGFQQPVIVDMTTSRMWVAPGSGGFD